MRRSYDPPTYCKPLEPRKAQINIEAKHSGPFRRGIEGSPCEQNGLVFGTENQGDHSPPTSGLTSRTIDTVPR